VNILTTPVTKESYTLTWLQRKNWSTFDPLLPSDPWPMTLELKPL
jgi:hypothetical protein